MTYSFQVIGIPVLNRKGVVIEIKRKSVKIANIVTILTYMNPEIFRLSAQESHSESRILSDSDKGQTVNIPNIHGFQ